MTLNQIYTPRCDRHWGAAPAVDFGNERIAADVRIA